MKSIKRNLKWAAKILSFLIMFQSCAVYHNYSSSVDEAIASNDKVKLDIIDDDAYRFKKLKIFENEYYGLAKINSDTYKRLRGRREKESDDKKFRYVQLNETELNNVHLKNKGASLALSIGIPIVVVSGIAVAIGASYSPTIDMQWSKPEMQ